MNRLQGVKESDGVITEYEFDPYGNISKEYTLTASGIKTTRYEYDGNNCLLISYDDRSSTRYTYDKSGNLTNKIYELSGRETKSCYSYDGYNRLSEFVSGDTTAEYTYNPEGLRESKTVNGNYTRFIYDGANIVGELTNDNYYIYYRGTEPISSKSYDNKGHYYRLDSHGNVTDLVNHLGESQKSYAYTPYGEEKLFGLTPSGEQTILYYWQKETDGTHNPFRYCGEYYDEESGLIYLRNRYYDPTTGRFITEDPARDGNNWYVYCENDPINRIDPKGTASFREKWEAFWKVGPFDAVSINNIGNATLKAAQKFALEKGLTSATDNIVDAYRHFSWNYDAVKKGISVENVMQVTTNHEVLTQIYMGKDSDGTKYYKVALSSLMDLQNNKIGRSQAKLETNKNKNSREVFEHLASRGGVVTSLDHVKRIWGIKDDWLYSEKDGVRGEVSVLIKNGLEENALNIVVANKNEIKFE